MFHFFLNEGFCIFNPIKKQVCKLTERLVFIYSIDLLLSYALYLTKVDLVKNVIRQILFQKPFQNVEFRNYFNIIK